MVYLTEKPQIIWVFKHLPANTTVAWKKLTDACDSWIWDKGISFHSKSESSNFLTLLFWTPVPTGLWQRNGRPLQLRCLELAYHLPVKKTQSLPHKLLTIKHFWKETSPAMFGGSDHVRSFFNFYFLLVYIHGIYNSFMRIVWYTDIKYSEYTQPSMSHSSFPAFPPNFVKIYSLST